VLIAQRSKNSEFARADASLETADVRPYMRWLALQENAATEGERE
jgi:hypothetical protein